MHAQPRKNYYRRMLRRRIPWFIVTGLFLAWAWDIYSGFMDPYVPPDIAERSLTYLDKSLKLEEIAVDQPAFIKMTLLSSDYADVLGHGRDSLDDLGELDLLDETGKRARAVMNAEMGTPLEDLSALDATTRKILGDEEIAGDEILSLARRLDSPNSYWWDAKLAERVLARQYEPVLSGALDEYIARCRRLFRLNLLVTAAGWLPLIAGLFFIPHAVRTLRSGWTIASLHRPVRYGSRWEPSLVVALLLAGDLSAGWLFEGVYLALGNLDPGFTFHVLLDSVWRLAAPAIALVILFRKPRHAVRSLGLGAPPQWRLLLAAFSIILIFQLIFYKAVDRWVEFDPTGGLDPMEKGWAGLFYGFLSACVLAPVAEEIFYRGILYRGLMRRFGFWLSASVSTLAFVLAHSYDALGLVSIGIFGFAMVVIYRATGSLTTTIALHALYNLMILLPEWVVYHAPPWLHR